MAAQEFRVQEESRRDQLIAIGSSLFFLAVITAVLWTRPQFRTSFGCAVAAAASLFFVWTLVREMQALSGRKNWPVVIDEQGVHYASPGQITWAEIAGLEPVRSRQRVDLRDAHGRVRVSLPYDLEDAHEVVQFVADMLSDRWPEVPLPHEFGQDLPTPMLAAGAAADRGAGRRYLLDARAPVGSIALRGGDGAGRRGLCGVAAPFGAPPDGRQARPYRDKRDASLACSTTRTSRPWACS